jgi:hypothetical protein
MSKIRLFALAVLGLMATVAAGCGDDSAPSASSTSTPAATLATGIQTMTYTDPDYDYSFEYPAAWFLSPQHDVSHHVLLYSYDPDAAVGDGRPVPRDKLKVFFWVAEGVDKPILEWLAEGRNNPGQPPLPTIVSQSEATLDGKTGVLEVLDEDGLKHTGYYIPIGDSRVFVVNAIPGDSDVWPQFEAVLASVRFPE